MDNTIFIMQLGAWSLIILLFVLDWWFVPEDEKFKKIGKKLGAIASIITIGTFIFALIDNHSPLFSKVVSNLSPDYIQGISIVILVIWICKMKMDLRKTKADLTKSATCAKECSDAFEIVDEILPQMIIQLNGSCKVDYVLSDSAKKLSNIAKSSAERLVRYEPEQAHLFGKIQDSYEHYTKYLHSAIGMTLGQHQENKRSLTSEAKRMLPHIKKAKDLSKQVSDELTQ